MKNQNSVLSVTSCSAIPTRLEIEERLAQLCQNHSCQAPSPDLNRKHGTSSKKNSTSCSRICSRMQPATQICTKKFCQTSAEPRQPSPIRWERDQGEFDGHWLAPFNPSGLRPPRLYATTRSGRRE